MFAYILVYFANFFSKWPTKYVTSKHMDCSSRSVSITNIFRHDYNVSYFTSIFKCVFVNAYYCILIENDTAFCTQVPNLQFVSIDSGNDLALFENDPLPEPNWPTLITPDGITNLQCVRWLLANDAYTSFKMIIIMCNPVTCLTHRPKWITFMMTSPNGSIFRVTGPLCGEFTGPRWIPPTKASDAELWCFLWSASE